MDIKRFDFLDFGASKGPSIEFGKERLFGKKGLGIDLDPKRVKIMNDTGYDCIVGDLTDLDLPSNCVKFVKMSHILEHMPSLDGVRKAVASGVRAATDFIVITGPYFDQDEYLKSLGFKLHWSDYPEHTCHLKVADLEAILDKQGLKDYELFLRHKIKSSANEHVHPLSSPEGSHRYDSKVHPKKKTIDFDKDVWVDFVCYIKLKPNVQNWKQIKKAYANQIPYIIKVNGKKLELSEEMIDMYTELDTTNQEQIDKISSLKQQIATQNEKITKLEESITSLSNSKTWKTVRALKAPVVYVRRGAKRVKAGSKK